MNRNKPTQNWVLIVFFAVTCLAPVAYAADQALVGVLADAVKPEVSKQLGLSASTLEKLKALIADREKQAAAMLAEAGDADAAEIAAKLAPFVRDSELKGMQILSGEQRERLIQIRLSRLGMESLGDEELAVTLSLSSEQKSKIGEMLSKRNADLLKASGTARGLTRAIYEDRLGRLLTERQMGEWNKMAGRTPEESSSEAGSDGTVQPALDDSATKVATDQSPVKAAPPPPELAKADTAKPDTAKPDAAKADTAKADTAKADTPATADEAAKLAADEPAKAAEPKAETPNTEASPPAKLATSDQPAETPAKPEAPAETSRPVADKGGDSAPSRNAIATNPKPSEAPRDGAELVFNFHQQPWNDVLFWFAEEAKLSIQMEDPPQGTFSYRDPKAYSPVQALDLINSVLLRKGYTMVQYNRMLFILNVEDTIPTELVPLVSVKELDGLGKFSQVKVLYQLTKLTPEDAEAELTPLLGPGQTLRVLPRSRQVLVTETVGKQIVIRDTIQAIENPDSLLDKKIIEFKLQYVMAEDVLTVARPLLGLPTDENTNEQINISVDTYGSRLFAKGSDEAIASLSELIPLLDIDPKKTDEPDTEDIGDPDVKTYLIQAADPEAVFQVLQTLLAGLPDVRMTLDRINNKVIVLGRPTDHKLVSDTLLKLEGEAKVFEVIQLRRVDPQAVVLLLTKMWGLGEEGVDGPTIDADPNSMKLMVRGTPTEIAQIKNVIEQMEAADGVLETGPIRMIPLTGSDARNALDYMRGIWPTLSVVPIKEVTSSAISSSLIRETTSAPPTVEPKPETPRLPYRRPPLKVPADPAPSKAGDDDAQLEETGCQEPVPTGGEPKLAPSKVAAPVKTAKKQSSPSDQEPIIVSITPNGIVIASNDIESLNKFERALKQYMGPDLGLGGMELEIIVYYLKYTKAEPAAQLLVDILGGGSAGGGGLGDITNLLGGGLGGVMGAFLGPTGGGSDDAGSALQTSSGISIVPDPRLNRLVVQGTAEQVKTVGELLKIIDKEESITEIETQGSVHLIPVIYTSATTVAGLVKEAFPNEVGTQSSSQGRGGQPSGGQPNPADIMKMLRGGRGGSQKQTKSEAPKMTISVHEPSNSLIVVAPEPLYRKVQLLVDTLDEAGTELNQVMEVLQIKDADPKLVSDALAPFFGTSGGAKSSTPAAGSSPATTSQDIQRRQEFIQRMFGGQRGGATGSRGGPGGSRGGATGGSRGGATGGATGGSSRGGGRPGGR